MRRLILQRALLIGLCNHQDNKCQAICVYLQDIILSGQVKHLPSDIKRDARQRGDLLTVHHVLQNEAKEREREKVLT